MKVEKTELWAERADQKHINNLPLARQFALMAVKLQMFGGITRHVWHPIRTYFFFLRAKFHLKALQQLRELTIFSGDTLDHVDCAFHYLEKQSVFDVDVDDVK